MRRFRIVHDGWTLGGEEPSESQKTHLHNYEPWDCWFNTDELPFTTFRARDIQHALCRARHAYLGDDYHGVGLVFHVEEIQ
jgi:hypothetical protein